MDGLLPRPTQPLPPRRLPSHSFLPQNPAHLLPQTPSHSFFPKPNLPSSPNPAFLHPQTLSSMISLSKKDDPQTQSSFFPKTQPSFFPWLEVLCLWLSIFLPQIAKSTKPSIRFSSIESNHYSPPSRFMIPELPPSASLKSTPSLRPPPSAPLNFDHRLMVSMDFDGLPDGDEMHSSDDVNEAKKRKGKGPTMLDYNAMSKAKQIGVQFNDKGQHFGVGSASLSSSVGILARQLIPVTYASWDQQKYNLASCRKKIILTKMFGCLRTYKATLTKQIRSFDDDPDAMEQMQLLKPANVRNKLIETNLLNIDALLSLMQLVRSSKS
ncbi:hypothetical protein PS1_038037 [Malus domestica]